MGKPDQLEVVRFGLVAVNSQYSTPGLGVHVSLTLPSPAVAVNAEGGGALDPLLPRHPLSEGVTNAAINRQYNFFTI